MSTARHDWLFGTDSWRPRHSQPRMTHNCWPSKAPKSPLRAGRDSTSNWLQKKSASRPSEKIRGSNTPLKMKHFCRFTVHKCDQRLSLVFGTRWNPSAAHQRHPRPFQRLRLNRRFPELDGRPFRESIRAVQGLQCPSSFTAGSRLLYAVWSVTHDVENSGQPCCSRCAEETEPCFPLHQRLGIVQSPVFPHFVPETAQRGKL